MEQLQHFSHDHLLRLVQLQPEHNNENSDKEDENEDEVKDGFAMDEPHVGKCNMCEEEIYTFQLCYYTCRDCDYSLHKFCAELPETKQNHPLHPGHSLKLYRFAPYSLSHEHWRCFICQHQKDWLYNYHCAICRFTMDIICSTLSEQKIDHPSHPHQLQRLIGQMISRCNACGNEHSGTFYHCATCFSFRIHLDCVILRPKLLLKQSTNESFSHSHLLTLSYSFPLIEKMAKYHPVCRVCEKDFDFNYGLRDSSYLWHYRCDKCRYYVHVDCATSKMEAFMSSILIPAGMGTTYKNFTDEDHLNLIRYPFADESVNLVMHHFINKGEKVIKEKIAGEMFSHPHPLILVDTLLNGSVSLHDPMKKVELFCDGCVRPVTSVPFYKCCQHDCGFVLHEWCTRLPSEIQHPDHPKHTLVLMPKVLKDVDVFQCNICELLCNGFAYGCKECEYYVDIHCGFIPDVITHEAHPNHLLLRFKTSSKLRCCKACQGYIWEEGFHCPTCGFFLDIRCALLLPGTIRHRYDNHPLSLRYYPAENHSGEYFCEICEDEINPEKWFYHCSSCASSMDTACAPVKLQCERSISSSYNIGIFKYLNVKFGGRHEIKNHPHPLTFLPGINHEDDKCVVCRRQVESNDMILECIQCKFVLHYYWCVKRLIEGSSSSTSGERGPS